MSTSDLVVLAVGLAWLALFYYAKAARKATSAGFLTLADLDVSDGRVFIDAALGRHARVIGCRLRGVVLCVERSLEVSDTLFVDCKEPPGRPDIVYRRCIWVVDGDAHLQPKWVKEPEAAVAEGLT